VRTIEGQPDLVQRLYEFGLFEGEEIEVLALAPFGDPIEIRLGNTRLSLRKSEASGVSIELT
jgi:ferrous iron transport protein A